MRWFRFEIREIWATGDGDLRGQVAFHFEVDPPGGGTEPAHPSVLINAFIKRSDQATFAEVEQALLDEARRLLSEAISKSDAANPQEIRAAVDREREDRERRWKEELGAGVEEALKGVSHA